MDVLLCAFGAHADKFKMRSMCVFSCVGMRGVQAVFDFLLQHNNKLFFFVSELLDLLLAGEGQPQADQPSNLADGLLMYSTTR
eukprot:215986-Pelagomonas_calceolata.AAC.1